MTWDEMDGIKRNRQFERLKELFFDTLGELWSKEFAEVKTVFEPLMQDEINNGKVYSRYGKTMQIIPDGEWSLICALRGRKSNGR